MELFILKIPRCRVLAAGPLPSHETLSLILDSIRTKFLLLLPEARQISIEPKALKKFLEKAESTKAGLVYSDFYDQSEHRNTLHPLNDYQFGSVRDDFDFGAIILFSVPAIRDALKKYGVVPGVKFAGLYDLRLKVSIDHPLYHLQEPLYTVIGNVGAIHAMPTGRQELPLQEKIFAYVDPRNLAVQKEMEIVFTDYLKKIGAYLPPQFREVRANTEVLLRRGLCRHSRSEPERDNCRGSEKRPISGNEFSIQRHHRGQPLD